MVLKGPGAEITGVGRGDPLILGPHHTRAYTTIIVEYRIIDDYRIIGLKSVPSHA